MFEPTRLAAMHLIDAYSQIVPLRRRAVATASEQASTTTRNVAATPGEQP